MWWRDFRLVLICWHMVNCWGNDYYCWFFVERNCFSMNVLTASRIGILLGFEMGKMISKTMGTQNYFKVLSIVCFMLPFNSCRVFSNFLWFRSFEQRDLSSLSLIFLEIWFHLQWSYFPFLPNNSQYAANYRKKLLSNWIHVKRFENLYVCCHHSVM